MIIYCAGPIKGDTTFQDNYKEIIKFVSQAGHSALSELNGKFNTSIFLSDRQIYTRDIKWIDGSQLIVAEVSGPSLGVGFEVAYALFQKKIPVLALASNETKISAMISGCNSNLLTVVRYRSVDEMKKIIGNYLNDFGKSSDNKGIHF